jgi:hypothetical protein
LSFKKKLKIDLLYYLHNYVYCSTIHNSQVMESVTNGQWIAKENVAYIHNGVLFSHKEEWNYVVCRKIDCTGDHHVQQDKPSSFYILVINPLSDS